MSSAGYELSRGVHRLSTAAILCPTPLLLGDLLVAARPVVPGVIRRLEALQHEWAHVNLTEAIGPQAVSSENEKRDAETQNNNKILDSNCSKLKTTTYRPTHPPTVWARDRWTGRPTDRAIDRFESRIHRPSDRPRHQAADPSIDLLTDRSIDRATYRTASRSTDRQI